MLFLTVVIGVFVIGGITIIVNEYQEQQRLTAAKEAEHMRLEALKTSLEGISATVFVREPNGSKTNLEHHLEQELINRGARVLLSDQKAGMEVLKQGSTAQLNSAAHFSAIGALVITEGCEMDDREWTEPKIDFEERQAKYEHLYRVWRNKGYTHGRAHAGVEPVLEERRHRIVKRAAISYELSFRLVGRNGELYASGVCGEVALADSHSHDEVLRKLAAEAIAKLDETNVWSRIII